MKNKANSSSVKRPTTEALLWQLPGFVIIKDCQSKYLAANSYATKLLGFNKLDEIIGIGDHDLRCDAARFAFNFIKEDQSVLANENTLTALYLLRYADNNIHKILCSKKPINDPITNKQIGIFCQATSFDDDRTINIASKLMRIDTKYLNSEEIKLGCYYIDNKSKSKINLTKQQTLCLFYLLRGKTAKEIGIILKISHRTVESHIKALKNKFNCMSRSELIEKALNLGYLHELPGEILI